MNKKSNVDSSAFVNLQKTMQDYKGYGETAERRKSDQVFRESVAAQISRASDYFNRRQKSRLAENQKKLDNFSRSVKNGLTTLQHSLAEPLHQNAVFFESGRADYDLNRIYELEAMVIDYIQEINQEGHILNAGDVDRAAFEEIYLRVQAYMDNINQALFEREVLLMGDIY